MKRFFRLVLAGVVVGVTAHLGAQSANPKTHRLEATPDTVAYGYYDAAAKPVLRIASGDIIDVDTLLTNTPRGLERAGVKPEDIEVRILSIDLAIQLASIAADVAITQLVDGKVGVHVKIPKSIFR